MATENQTANKDGPVIRTKRYGIAKVSAGQPRAFALGRLKAGTMNRTEREYEKHLEDRKKAGEVLWWKFEAVKLRLADSCQYCPDFLVMTAAGELQAHEVKGSLKFIQDDAKVKVKVAAQEFPFRFLLVAPNAKKDGGGWQVLEVGNGNKVEIV